MAEHQTRIEIEQQMQSLRDSLEAMGAQAREHAYMIGEGGLNIGEKGNTLFTGGAGDWEAPKRHPVWAPEVAYEARTVERMGAATFEYEPQYRQLQAWAEAGKPEIWAEADRDVDFYARLDDLRTGNDASSSAEEVALLHTRLDAIQAGTDQHHSREQGIGY